MMKRQLYLITLLSMLLGLGACNDDQMFVNGGDGILQLSVGLSDKVQTVSRSLSQSEQTELEKDCKIRIYKFSENKYNLIQKYQGIANIPESISLSVGSYKVRVTAGDSVAAAFDKRFFEGSKVFSITKGTAETVKVNCTIANTVVAINWDESLDEVFNKEEEYKVTVTSATGELLYTSSNPDVKGYFSVPQSNRTLSCKFEAIKLDGSAYSVIKTIDVQASTLYTLNFAYSGTDKPTGGAAIQITIDESSLQDENMDFTIKQRPVVTCRDEAGIVYDLGTAMHVVPGTTNSYTFVVATSSTLTNFLITNDDFGTFGLPVSCDMKNLVSTDVETLRSAGLTFEELVSDEKGGQWAVTFSQDLVAKMTETERTVVTNFIVTDENNLSRSVTWTLEVSSATVSTSSPAPADIWTTKATLYGIVVGELKGEPGFRYRSVGSRNDSEWQTVQATLDGSGKKFGAEISGLTPGTTYEYQALDGTDTSSEIKQFVTESEFQPENASFESLSGSSPLLIYGEGESMWWDTGNHGSSSLGKNVTTADTSLKHSGNQSILLSSQLVALPGTSIGKFAAGNLFAGKYLKTDGTDGILGWGRPCTSRPTALKVWVRYVPGTVEYASEGHISKGEMDRGNIYAAIGDWAGQEYNGETWPFIVRTKSSDPSLFSTEKGTYSGDGIIAYAGKVFTEEVGTEIALAEVVIPFDYDNYGGKDRKPTSIIIVASASQFGDFFAGGNSKMWIDDVELLYE